MLALVSGSLTLWAQPANDNNSTATDVSVLINTCSADGAYTTVSATADASGGSCWSNGPNHNVWFRFTATSTGFIKVQLKTGGSEGTIQYPMLALWDSTGTQLSCMNNNGQYTDIEFSYLGLTAGTTYYISADNHAGGGYRGTFKLCLSDVVDNDYYEGATDITSLINTCSGNAAYSTLFAGADRNAGTCWSNGPNNNRWFKFTASTTGFIKVQLFTGGSEGTIQYPMLALWRANGTSQLSCMNNNGQYTDIELSYLGLTAGVTYYISVDNHTGTGFRGSFKLCLSDVVDNDYHSGATDISSLINSCSANAAYSTMYASADRNSGSCWSNGPNNNRWFKFTATTTGYMKVQLYTGGSEGTIQYPMLALWDASGNTQLACMNNNGQYTDIELNYLGLVAGATYYISVDNHTGTGYRGSFKLCLSDMVDNDYHVGATDLTSLLNSCSANAAYSTLYAGADKNSGTCWSNGPNYNRWFKFTASSTGYIKVQLFTGGSEGTIQYPMMALWDSTGNTQVACMNNNGQYTDIEMGYQGLNPGATYYISVDNHTGTGYRGSFKLCLSDAIDNDYYVGATDITSMFNTCSANAAYSTLYASADKNAGTCWSNGPNYNRWFKFTASSTGYIKVQLFTGGSEGTIQYPMLALWASNGTTQLACMNNNGQYADIELDYQGLTPGTTYYISVDNSIGNSYRGTFKLCYSDVVDNNYFDGATDLSSSINGCSANAAYSTLYASADKSAGTCWSNGPNYNRWFKFTATSTGYIRVQVNTGGTEGTLQYPMLALWASNGTTQLACMNSSGQYTDIELDYQGLTAGLTYYVSVDNFNGVGYRGTFTFCIYDQPDYNYYDGATVLTDLNGWCSANAAYTTQNASADKSAGSCWSNGPNYNRWFKFTAQHSTATIQVKTGGSEGTIQYPMVALWASNGTTQLACTNNSGQYTDITLSYSSLVAGNIYYISVDNFVGLGYRGTFKLCLSNIAAVTYYSRGNGDWSDTSTWSTSGLGGAVAGTVPGSGNVVYIQDNRVTVSSPIQCAELNISSSGSNTSVSINNSTLSVNGRLSMSNSSAGSCQISVQNNGSLTVANDLNISRTGGSGNTRIDITRGSMAIGQDMSWTSSGGNTSANILTMDSSSVLSVMRDLTLTYTSGQKISMSVGSSALLSVGRDLTFSSSAAGMTEMLFTSSSAMSIKRNIVRGTTPYGILNFSGAATLTFNGSVYQQVMPASAGSGGDAITYNHVVINNTSGYNPDITMGGGIATINGNLIMASGIIQTSTSSYIALTANSSTTLGNSSCYINGPMTYVLASSTPSSVRNFPIGKGSSYRPVSLTLTHTDNTSVTYTAELINSSPALLGYTLPFGVSKVSEVRYWQLDRQNVSNLSSAVITLYYRNDDGVNDYTNLAVIKSIGSSSIWNNIGGTATGNNSGSITSGVFSSFSKFTLGNLSGGLNTLPVELLSFTAKPDGKRVFVSWSTASEHNSDYFTIEKSMDGHTFSEVASLDAAGKSDQVLNYSLIDEQPFSGHSYYRIKETDFDGTMRYSSLVSVNMESGIAESFSILPNPSRGNQFQLLCPASAPMDMEVQITDLQGKVLYRGLHYFDGSGRPFSCTGIPDLQPGIYTVLVRGLTQLYHSRLVVE